MLLTAVDAAHPLSTGADLKRSALKAFEVLVLAKFVLTLAVLGGAGSGAPHTSEEPHASMLPKFEAVTGAGADGCAG